MGVIDANPRCLMRLVLSTAQHLTRAHMKRDQSPPLIGGSLGFLSLLSCPPTLDFRREIELRTQDMGVSKNYSPFADWPKKPDRKTSPAHTRAHPFQLTPRSPFA